jgi:ParB family chromosome partitioning protein
MSDPAIDPAQPAARKRPIGLGRGLSALMGEVQREEPVVATTGESRPGILLVSVTDLAPHPDQPRRHFDEEALGELALSIAARGVIQPIVVRPWQGKYQIVAGERRWRAAQRAQLHEVPVIVRDFDDAETLEIALVENIQREDLNVIEEAEAYHRLIRDYGHSHEALGRLVHKSRSHIANLIRLLDLPPPVRRHLVEGRLTMGHARALINTDDAAELADQVINKAMSVRETEALVRKARGPARQAGRVPSRDHQAMDADIALLERQLGDMIGLKVVIGHQGQGGTVTLQYSSLDQLDMICHRLSGEPI